MSRVRAVVAAAAVGVSMLAGCGGGQQPMVPDNPTADPLMMDAGGPPPADPPAASK
jgi:hypothetical protein